MNIKNKFFQILGISELLDQSKALIEARIALFKLQIKDQIAGIMVKVIPFIIFLLLLFLFVLFVSISLGFLLSDQLGSYFYGFGIIALFYMVICLIMLFIKSNKRVQKKLRNQVFKAINEDNA